MLFAINSTPLRIDVWNSTQRRKSLSNHRPGLTGHRKLGTIRAMNEKFFSIFGKITLVVLIIGALAGGGYYFGRSGKINLGQSPVPEAATTTNPLPPVTETPQAASIIAAGLGSESGLSFTRYTIAVPEGWVPVHTSTNEGTPVDTLTITNGSYELKIFQAATGGAMCLYPGNADFEGPSSRYDTFAELTTADGLILRRGGKTVASGNTRGFTVCQKGTENFGQPTVFGHTGYTTPLNPDNAMISQMDGMIASLKKS